MQANERALPPVTQSSALQAPECSWRTGDEIALQAPECLWRPIRGRIRLSKGKGIYLCLMAQIEVQKVQEVQWVQIRPIRLIRGKTEIKRTRAPLTRRRISL